MASTQFTISYDENGVPQIKGLNAQQQQILLAAAQKNPQVQQVVNQAAQVIQQGLQENKIILQTFLREGTVSLEEARVLLKEYKTLEEDIQYLLNEGFLDTAKDKAKDLYAKAGAAVTTAGTVAKQGLEKLGQFTKEHPGVVKAIALTAVVGLALAASQQAAASELLGNIKQSINGVPTSSISVYGTDGSDILNLISQYQKAAVEGNDAARQPVLKAITQLIGGVISTSDGQSVQLTKDVVVDLVRSDPSKLNWLNDAFAVTQKAIDLTNTPLAKGVKQAAMNVAFKQF